MPSRNNILVGLEVGTSKICAAVGEVGADGAINVIALGQSRSRGVRKGEIVNPTQTEEDIRHALVEAEQKADLEIRSVYLGITGGHVRGFTNRGIHAVLSADREITGEDVEDVLRNARAINIPADNTVLQTVRQHYIVDGQGGIESPLGYLGARLEVDMHVVHGNTNRISNSVRAVKNLGIIVEEVVFNGIASALATLNAERKEVGTLVIDLGAGTTDYVLYSRGVIQHSGVLAVGGDHITSDLSIGLKVSQSRAEELKLQHGTAVEASEASDEIIELPGGAGMSARRLPVAHLQRIMAMRVEEIFELIAMELDRNRLLPRLGAGVVICGGGACIPRVAELAADVFGVGATVAEMDSAGGNRDALSQPGAATAIGLLRFAAMQSRRFQPSGPAIVRQWMGDLLGGILTRRKVSP
jgi:cell division protein FtsA